MRQITRFLDLVSSLLCLANKPVEVPAVLTVAAFCGNQHSTSFTRAAESTACSTESAAVQQVVIPCRICDRSRALQLRPGHSRSSGLLPKGSSDRILDLHGAHVRPRSKRRRTRELPSHGFDTCGAGCPVGGASASWPVVSTRRPSCDQAQIPSSRFRAPGSSRSRGMPPTRVGVDHGDGLRMTLLDVANSSSTIHLANREATVTYPGHDGSPQSGCWSSGIGNPAHFILRTAYSLSRTRRWTPSTDTPARAGQGREQTRREA